MADPRDVKAYVGLGESHRKKGNIQQALQQCRRALELSPQDETLHFEKGKLLLEASMPDDARKAIKTAPKLKPDFSKAKEMLAAMEERE